MGRTLSEVIGALPKARRRRVEARYQQLKNEVVTTLPSREIDPRTARGDYRVIFDQD